MLDPTCPTCGRAAPNGTRHCPWDGAPLTEASSVVVSADALALPPGIEFTGDGSPAPDPLIGAKIGDYVVQQRLGHGGMGIVYAGEQPMIGKRVAIKVIRPEYASDRMQMERLLAEARAVNAIRHRGIIDIFNFGQLPDGRHYVVMECLDGRSLDFELAGRGPLPIPEILEILDEMLAALGAGHGAGIIHRDLKPSNVFLVRQPDGSRYVKLLDFGLAKRSSIPNGATPQTRQDVFVGTPEYIAPEQARAESIGPWTDLYAAGVVAFELLTGRLPFEANAPIDYVMKHLEAKPPAPSSLRPEVSPEFDALVLRLLEKVPANRPASVDEVRRELARMKQSHSVAPMVTPAAHEAGPTPTPSDATLRRAVRRSRAPLYLVAGFAGLSVAGFGAWALTSSSTPAGPAPAIVAAPAPAVPAKQAPSPEPIAQPEPIAEPERPARTPSAAAEVPQPVRERPNVRPARAAEPRVPTRPALKREIDRLERLLRARSAGEPPPDNVLAFLEKFRAAAERADTAEARTALSERLERFERQFLAAPP